MSRSVRLQGPLAGNGLERVLLDIHEHRWTGTLKVFSGGSFADKTADAYFMVQRGRLVTVYRRDQTEQLAVELIEQDLLPASNVQRAFALSFQREERVETILVREKIVSEASLLQIYEHIVLERLRPFLALQAGHYIFEGADEDDTLSDLALSNQDLFLAQGLDIAELLDAAKIDRPVDDNPVDEVTGVLRGPLWRHAETSIGALPESETDFLNSILAELARGDRDADSVLLLLRYVSRIFARGILFRVDGGYLESLGEFGFSSGRQELAAKIQRARLGVTGSGSLWDSVIAAPYLEMRRFQATDAEADFFNFLEASAPLDYVVASIGTPVRVVLYGDSGAGERLKMLTTGLSIFLSHVGLPLERQFLVQQLQDLTQR